MYFIMEFQKTDDSTVPYIVYTADTQQEAESKYHSILASAAISEVPYHSATVLTDEGVPMMNKTYTHEATE